jgi:hypothetical protein
MKHTPGPWDFYAEFGEGAFICMETGENIAELDCNKKETKEVIANGNLISAAPELLEALKYCVDLLEEGHCQETKRLAQAAIKKAEGV